ncbi:hypothetical protein DdX_10041 [Ditylenchus destructor]|uniref:Uncharacterized protein n=1 Tax=Ditylenchus destructor TaxID=166010 RepID=A0AAD4N199_9BILA|nr:hypothetical protein DdX_10041 [Ditylenchus destructor]
MRLASRTTAALGEIVNLSFLCMPSKKRVHGHYSLSLFFLIGPYADGYWQIQVTSYGDRYRHVIEYCLSEEEESLKSGLGLISSAHRIMSMRN